MKVDVISAVNKGLEGIQVDACVHAKTLREKMIQEPGLKSLSRQQIIDATTGALENMRTNKTPVKEAITLAITTQKSPVPEISGSMAQKILGSPSTAPKSADRKVPRALQIPEKAPTPPPAPKPKASFLSNMDQAQKVNFGLTAMFAAFSAIGALDALGKIKKKDENGQSQIQPTQVGMLILNTLLTAGLGFAAYQQVRGR